MIVEKPVLHIARVVLESTTPLSIATGRGEGVFDSQLVRDANGLPAIPGTTLAGVLRHLYGTQVAERPEERKHHPEVAALFGEARDQHGLGTEQPSLLHVSWGCLHDSHGRPVEGLLLGEARKALADDPLLRDALQEQPVLRNHVRIDQRGAAADGGQFDRTSLRAGHRFTAELSLWSDVVDPRWEALLGLLYRTDFRLGGATRRGLGAFKVQRLHQRVYDLRDGMGFADYAQLPSELGDLGGLAPYEPTAAATAGCLTATLRLQAEDLFRFGQGCEPFSSGGSHEESVDLLPVGEPVVEWTGGKGSLTERRLVIPASAIKGALRHRVGYYHRLLSGALLDPQGGAGQLDEEPTAAEAALFGTIKGKGRGSGRAGRLLLDDVALPVSAGDFLHLMHNGIDRFTGGVREHVLYSEELACMAREIEIPLTIADSKAPELAEHGVRRALQLALADLSEGRLALGAGSARGHGCFSGSVEWSDGGKWIAGGAA